MSSRSRLFTVINLLGVSVLAACQALTPASPTPAPTATSPIDTPAPTDCTPGPACDPGPVDSFDITIEGVDVRTNAGTPPVVTAVLSGTLPDASCTTIESVKQERESTTFRLTVIAQTDPLRRCAFVLTPFTQEVVLDVEGLPAGTYTVMADDVMTTFELATSDADVFELQLQNALGSRDPAALQALMAPNFLMGYWRSEGSMVPSGEAAAQILAHQLNPAAAPMLGPLPDTFGFDPASLIYNSDDQFAHAAFSSGWGADGRGEALLVVARRPDGSLYFHSLLFARDGFSDGSSSTACTVPVDVPAINERVEYNDIAFDLHPSLAYAVSVVECPAVLPAPDQYPGDAHPPYTAFIFPTLNRDNLEVTPELRVYALSGDLSSFVYPLNSLADLRRVLDERQNPIAWLDRAPLTTRRAYVDFENGEGVRALVQYMQDFYFFSNNGLLYEFSGLTENGRHFVRLQYAVSAPFLMEFGDSTDPRSNLNPNAIPVPAWPTDDFDAQMGIVKAYNAEALARFEQMQASDLNPGLIVLDDLVQSLRVGQP